MSIPFSQFNPLSTYLLVTVSLFSNLQLCFCLADHGFHTLTPPVKTAVPLSSPCHPSLHSSALGLCHLILAWTCYSLGLDYHSLEVSQGSAQCRPHGDHPHHPMECSSSLTLCPVTFYHFLQVTHHYQKGSRKLFGEEFVLFQSPLLEQKLHEGRTFPVLSTGGHSQCLRSYLAGSQMPSEVRQLTAMSDEDRMKSKKEECVLLWVHVPWKAFNIEIRLQVKQNTSGSWKHSLPPSPPGPGSSSNAVPSLVPAEPDGVWQAQRHSFLPTCSIHLGFCFLFLVFGNYVSPLANLFNPRPSWVCSPIAFQNTTTFFQKRQLKI